jgi:hypothetical protein
MTAKPTVWADRLEGLPAIKMVWTARPNVQDIRKAFSDITAHLSYDEQSLYVVVDISSNPRFPLFDTVIHCLTGPFKHENLREWLVVGDSPAARQIESLLSRVTGRSNIRWFGTEAQAMAYLDEQAGSWRELLDTEEPNARAS